MHVQLKKQFMVGLLVVLTLVLLGIFAWLMGSLGPFQKRLRFYVLYNFVGGIELGSPVRVAGVKVGKVERIDFLPEPQPGQQKASVSVTISVSQKAASHVRTDSRFYVNLAGLIGERYVEVSPGSLQAPVLSAGSVVKGVDPPRIDQLLSQGYGVFGKLLEFWDENQGEISDLLAQLHQVFVDANKILNTGQYKKIGVLIENLNTISSDVSVLTGKLRKPESEEVFSKLYEMIRRAHEVDRGALKRFFQDEGIRAKVF